ncbi:MAG: phytanoyl-CoA dioxygenase [Gemmatimonadetes bacterium]|nr:phytanoyl-CoA dioxygenase [Gemmatimonadota bacterium]
MSTQAMLDLTYRGEPLGREQDDFGQLTRSDDCVTDREELRRRFEAEGYLYIPGLLDRDEVLAARTEVMQRLWDAGILDKRHPMIDGIALSEAEYDGAATGPFMPYLAKNNAALEKVLYDGPMIRFYEFFLGGPVSHFDYTWFRCKRPGRGDATTPHCDIVYMSRGTKDLYTSWTPFGDVPLEMGGLMVLEGSHRNQDLKSSYGSTDVDLYCSNVGDQDAVVQQARDEDRELTTEERQSIQWNSTGAYSSDAIGARRELGGRWLTSEYEMGDLLLFSMYLMHASSDNRSNAVRISSDSRYQLASQPQDERWIGDDPPAHGIRAKRGMVC